MKNKSFLQNVRGFHCFALISFLFFFIPKEGDSQVAGDYGAYVSGTWNTPSVWKIYDGSSWATSSVAGASPNSSLINCYVLPGCTLTLTISQTACNNITINNNGKLYTNSGGSNTYLYVYGNITCDGVIGNGGTFDAISFGIEGSNCLFTGAGTVDCSRIRKNLNVIVTTNLVIDINVNLRFATGSQTQIYNSADNSTFNVTLNAGKILNLAAIGGNVGNVAMDGINGTDPSERAGNYMINGTLIISGFLYITTNNFSSPCTFTIGASGIVQTYSVIANVSGPAGHTLNMMTGALLQITGTPFTNPFTLTNNNYNLSVGSTIDYSALGVQTVDSNLTYANLRISGTGNKTGGGPLDVLGNLTIISGTLIPYPSNPIINLGGNWSDYSTAGFTEAGSTVTLNGSGIQTIMCTSGGEDYSTLRMNKPGGKAYLSAAPATIIRLSVLLDLISGNIVSSVITSTYYVQIQNTAIVTNTSDNSFVEGTCARQLISASPVNFTFPVGKIAKYRPEGINGTPSASSVILCEYYKADPNTVGNVTQLGPGLDHVSRCEYWRTRLIGTATPQLFIVTLSWDTYSACPLGVTLLGDLRVASWSNPTVNVWNSMGNSATTGNTTAGTVTASTASSFVSSASGTPFTLSSFTSENPLPIELLFFRAKAVHKSVMLDWSTASETNNDYFTIERSSDGNNFVAIAQVKGAGSTTELNSYEYTDNSPLSGISYYRLRQTDYDGENSESDIVSVQYKKTNDFAVVISPVPVKDVLNVYCSGRSEIVNIEIIQSDGRVLKSFPSSSSNASLDLSALPQGIYFLNIFSDDEQKTIRFIKQ